MTGHYDTVYERVHGSWVVNQCLFGSSLIQFKDAEHKLSDDVHFNVHQN